jgi:hypothetical protein
MRQPQAGAAGALVLGHAGTNGVDTVAADVPTVLVGDHRSELNTYGATGAADDQCRVGRQWALLHHSREGWHAGFHMRGSVIPLKATGSWALTPDWEEPSAEISAGVPTGGQISRLRRQSTKANGK